MIGGVNEAAALARAYEADVVLVAGGGFENPHAMREMVWDLEADDIQVIMAPGVTDVSSERIRVRPVGGLPLLHVDRPRSQDALRWAKRTFDIVGSAVLLTLAAPLLLWTAWKIKSNDGGPVLFRQTRVGRDGTYFTCLKFRSMVVDAERVLADLHEKVGYEAGLFKMKQDPRITRPGQWIRRYSLDELPQLINVLRGDMSLVGPRPPLPLEVDRYTAHAVAPAARAPRTDRPLAGLGSLRPLVGRVGPPGPLLRRQLVDDPGRTHPGPHRRGRAQLARRLLRLVGASTAHGRSAPDGRPTLG